MTDTANRLRLSMFAEPPARQKNDKLVASFAQLQPRSQLALMVTALVEEAEERIAERAAGI